MKALGDEARVRFGKANPFVPCNVGSKESSGLAAGSGVAAPLSLDVAPSSRLPVETPFWARGRARNRQPSFDARSIDAFCPRAAAP